WSWIDPVGGNFASPQKWSSDLVPLATQDALFYLDSTYTITFTAAASTLDSNVRAGVVSFALGGNTYTVCSGLNVAPAAGDLATLNIAGGTVTAVTAGVGGD